MKYVYSLIFSFAIMSHSAWVVAGDTLPGGGTPSGTIPEPSTIVLIAAGLVGLGLARRRKK